MSKIKEDNSLNKWKELLDLGVITQEEYDSKLDLFKNVEGAIDDDLKTIPKKQKDEVNKFDSESKSIMELLTMPEKFILGVCSKNALNLKIKPIILRLVFIVLLIFYPILALMIYLVLAGKVTKSLIAAWFGAGFGALLGIPLSYFFQPEMVKNKVGGFSGYFNHFDQISEIPEVMDNVRLSIGVFAILGGLITALIVYLLNKK